MSDNPRTKYYPLKVVEVIRETHDSASFAFEVPAEHAELFAYEAGQFLTFEIPWADFHIHRSYSLCTAPGVDPTPKVTIKRVDDGRMSNWFNDNVEVGSVIQTQPPAGRFTLKADSTLPLTLYGGGSGITPVISIAKAALATTERDVTLVYANRDVQSIIFKDELLELACRYPTRFRVTHFLDNIGGFVTAEQVASTVESRIDSECYICGPAPFMDTVEAALQTAGLTRDRIHVERFVSPMDPDRAEGRETPISTGGDVPKVVVMKIDGVSHDIQYEAGKTILECALEQGIEAEYQCEEGYCGCCMAKLRKGDVEMPITDALTEADIENGWVLTCQAHAKGKECEVDYDASY